MRRATAILCALVLGCGGKATSAPIEDVATADTLVDTAEVAPIAETFPLVSIEIVPSNETIFIETTPPTAATLYFKVICHEPDGTVRDITASAKMSVDPPSLGTFSGPTFTSTLDPLAFAVDGTVTATSPECPGVGTSKLTVVKLRSDDDLKFFFIEPYGLPPSPTRDVLKFGTVPTLDIALTIDTTSSMAASLKDLQTNLSSTFVPAFAKVSKSVPGMAIAAHDDFPYDPYGSSTCGDLPAFVGQPITTTVTKAQAAIDALAIHCGGDVPDSQLAALHYVLTGKALTWPGGTVAAHTPAAGTSGGVDFRKGALPIVVELTDSDWQTAYPFATPTLSDLTSAFVAQHARFVQITTGTAEAQANDLSDATKSNVALSAFGGKCGAKCCTDVGGTGRDPTGPGGSCRLNFLADSTTVSKSLVLAIQTLAIGTRFDVTAVVSNDPTNPDGVDATNFVKFVRAMTEGDVVNGCAARTTKDTDGDSVEDTFVAVTAGEPVCFEIIVATNTTVPAKSVTQLFHAFVDVVGQPGAFALDRRPVAFLVPKK